MIKTNTTIKIMRYSRITVVGAILSMFTVGAQAIPFTDQASFLAGTGALTVDDFDSSPWAPANTALPQPVVNLGNSWTGNNDLIAVTSASVSGPQSISSIDTSPDLIDTITAILGGFDTAVGGFLFLDFTSAVTLNAFDASNTLIESVTTTFSSGWQFIGLTSGTNIAKVEFISTSQPTFDDFALDDFHFGAASPVPEPSLLALLSIGLVGVGVVHRRRKNH